MTMNQTDTLDPTSAAAAAAMTFTTTDHHHPYQDVEDDEEAMIHHGFQFLMIAFTMLMCLACTNVWFSIRRPRQLQVGDGPRDVVMDEKSIEKRTKYVASHILTKEVKAPVATTKNGNISSTIPGDGVTRTRDDGASSTPVGDDGIVYLQLTPTRSCSSLDLDKESGGVRDHCDDHDHTSTPLSSAAPSSDQADDGDDELECSICLCEYHVGERLCYSPNALCGHTFHEECITEWLMKHDTCPCCRNNYLEGDVGGDDGDEVGRGGRRRDDDKDDSTDRPDDDADDATAVESGMSSASPFRLDEDAEGDDDGVPDAAMATEEATGPGLTVDAGSDDIDFATERGLAIRMGGDVSLP